jgi:hypothetical protein
VQSFFAEEEVRDTTKAANISVTVKVIDPKEREDRRSVRLWPTGREGKPVAVELNSNEVSRLRTRERIADALAERLAKEVAKLFYEHPLQDEDE